MRAEVKVFLKDGVLDSQGKAVHHALDSLGFDMVSDVRIGKNIIIELDESSVSSAEDELEKMCQALLANTVIEDYTVEITK